MSCIGKTLARLRAKLADTDRVATEQEVELNATKVRRGRLREAIKLLEDLDDSPLPETPPVRPAGKAKKKREYTKKLAGNRAWVMSGRTRVDGTPTYRPIAVIDGKRLYAGTYTDRDKAQAAADAYLEQIENNPDRPPRKKRGPKARPDLPPPAAHKYECNKCGRDYVDKPERCANCKGKAFTKINPDGSGQFDLQESVDE